jgi:hypothetical protein
MNPEQTLEAIKVMQAHYGGASIQWRSKGDKDEEWRDVQSPSWNFSAVDFRIKPEPSEIEVWVNDQTGRILDTQMLVHPVGYTKRRFREII